MSCSVYNVYNQNMGHSLGCIPGHVVRHTIFRDMFAIIGIKIKFRDVGLRPHSDSHKVAMMQLVLVIRRVVRPRYGQ